MTATKRAPIAPLVRESLFPRPSSTALTREQVVNELASRRGGRTLEAMAADVGVSLQYLARVLAGERSPGERVLEWLGLRKVTAAWYERTMRIPDGIGGRNGSKH